MRNCHPWALDSPQNDKKTRVLGQISCFLSPETYCTRAQFCMHTMASTATVYSPLAHLWMRIFGADRCMRAYTTRTHAGGRTHVILVHTYKYTHTKRTHTQTLWTWAATARFRTADSSTSFPSSAGSAHTSSVWTTEPCRRTSARMQSMTTYVASERFPLLWSCVSFFVSLSPPPPPPPCLLSRPPSLPVFLSFWTAHIPPL